jgi:hypothetical protein
MAHHHRLAIKADLVTSAVQAARLGRLGVLEYGVPLTAERRLANPHAVSPAIATEIAAGVGAGLVIGVIAGDQSPRSALRVVRAAGLDAVELALHPEPDAELVEELRAAGIEVRWSGVVVSLDDDPSSIEGALTEGGVARDEVVELELAPGWRALIDADVDDLSLADIDGLATRWRLFISAGAIAPDEVARRLPHAAGVTYHLGTSSPHGVAPATLERLLGG